MIESIQIKDVATYGNSPQQLSGLSKFNFLYGSNGSGKTTISRVIADEATYPTCSVQWSGGNKLQAMVYNRDFVANNFQSSELKGIFTLGQQDIAILNKIAEEKKLLDGLQQEIQKLKNTLHGDDGSSGKKGDLATLEEEIKTTCWSKKQKFDASFSGPFEGYRGSSEKFKQQIIQELSVNTATLQSLDYLEKRASSVFGETPAAEKAVSTLDVENIIAHESNLILGKRVIGKEDVDIAAMIKKLSSSDWVREGRTFFEVNNKTCQFCQQKTSDDFAKSLNEYFDDAFIADTKAMDTLITNYETDAARLQQVVQSIIIDPSKFLDIETQGLNLFFSSKTNCSKCHSGFLFTNQSFENNGLYFKYNDDGRKRLTGLDSDDAKFKVPSLRNVEFTGPYMYDGSINTLEGVIDHYSNKVYNHPNKSKFVNLLYLTAGEKAALVAFLKTLSDHNFIHNKQFQNE